MVFAVNDEVKQKIAVTKKSHELYWAGSLLVVLFPDLVKDSGNRIGKVFASSLFVFGEFVVFFLYQVTFFWLVYFPGLVCIEQMVGLSVENLGGGLSIFWCIILPFLIWIFCIALWWSYLLCILLYFPVFYFPLLFGFIPDLMDLERLRWSLFSFLKNESSTTIWPCTGDMELHF